MTPEQIAVFDPAHDALNRMRRAAARGTGCHLTADMIASLALTFLGQAWEEDDPRNITKEDSHADA